MNIPAKDYLEMIKGKKKPSKYRSTRVECDGIKFQSKLEANYFTELKLQHKMGCIAGFGRQIRFPLGAGVEYVADFVVWGLDGVAEVVECKGFLTDVAAVKLKFFQDKYPMIKLTVER